MVTPQSATLLLYFVDRDTKKGRNSAMETGSGERAESRGQRKKKQYGILKGGASDGLH